MGLREATRQRTEDNDVTDSHADRKQGSCQKFIQKHDRLRGNRVDSMVTLGLGPSTWISSCKRPEQQGPESALIRMKGLANGRNGSDPREGEQRNNCDFLSLPSASEAGI